VMIWGLSLAFSFEEFMEVPARSDNPLRLMPFREEVLVKGSFERVTRQITLFVSS